MGLGGPIVLISAIVPVAAAVWANRSTSLIHATVWAVLAWTGWLAAAWTGQEVVCFLALTLTTWSGLAVLGARRPGAAAWNFVVVALLLVVLLATPMQFDNFRSAFLVALVGATVTNYLPTRLAGGAILLGLGCGWQMVYITHG